MASLRTLRPELYPLAQAFVRVLERVGYRVTVTSVRRDRDKQRELWTRCMEGRSNFPAAYPGTSPHELGIAFDLHLDPPHYDGPGHLWERLGLRWGGRFRDEIHFDFYPRGFLPSRHPKSCPGPRRMT